MASLIYPQSNSGRHVANLPRRTFMANRQALVLTGLQAVLSSWGQAPAGPKSESAVSVSDSPQLMAELLMAHMWLRGTHTWLSSSRRHEQGSCLAGQGRLCSWAGLLQSADIGGGSEEVGAVELTCMACTSLLTMGGMTRMPRFQKTASAMRDTCTRPAPSMSKLG